MNAGLDSTSRAGAWDVIVCGAGPAGSVAAGLLARRGMRVLLVEKDCFPRYKVCGGCLSAAGCALLNRAEFAVAASHAPRQHFDAFAVAAGGPVVTLPLPRGQVVDRATFDQELVAIAEQAGATFVSRTRATVGAVRGGFRQVALERLATRSFVTARCVLVADGLAGQSLRAWPALAARIAPHALVGGSTDLSDAVESYAPQVIHMACGGGGYVGLVRLPDGGLHVAAALSPRALRGRRGLGAVAATVVAQAGFPALPALTQCRWRAVPQLTRTRRALADERLFIVGDAAGYVEPFTGEGMTWALTTALAVVPFAQAAVRGEGALELPRLWTRRCAELLGGSQRRCALLTGALRYPVLVRALLRVLAWQPGLAHPFTAALECPALPPGSVTS